MKEKTYIFPSVVPWNICAFLKNVSNAFHLTFSFFLYYAHPSPFRLYYSLCMTPRQLSYIMFHILLETLADSRGGTGTDRYTTANGNILVAQNERGS